MGDSSQPQPFGPFNFGGFDLNEVMRMLRSEGPFNAEIARQVAGWVALEGGTEADIPAADVTLFEELTRTAHIHVSGLTGLGADLPPSPRVVGRRDWSLETLGHLEPVLVALAEAMAAHGREGDDDPMAGMEAEEAQMASLMTAVAPLLLGMQAGFMVGHLAARTMSRYEMPLPLDAAPAAVFVGPNVSAFEADWALPREELRFYLALAEVAHAAVHSVPWVRRRLLDLGRAYASAFQVDPSVVEEQLGGGFNPMDPSTFEVAVSDPAEFMGAIRSPRQQEVLARITAFTTLVEAYVDAVVEEVGSPLIPEFSRIREACHRNRVERGDAARFLEALLGFELDKLRSEKAAAFCAGVLERGGHVALRRLWEDERMIPTPAEVEAPGLWLERIDLPL